MANLNSLPPQLQRRIKETADCWVWQACVRPDGYGQFHGRPAHRVVYELLVGPIGGGLQLDHLCRNKPCTNPDHLEPVTQLENMRRRYALYTHCKSGHEYTPANTYIMPSGYRDCRACIRRRAAEYKARRRAS